MTTRGDVDDQTAREVADFLGCEPDANFGAAFAALRGGRDGAADDVVLQAGNVSVAVPAGEFAAACEATFHKQRLPGEQVSGLGVGYLARSAAELGFPDTARKLEQFKRAMKGLAVVRRDDGRTPSPEPVSPGDIRQVRADVEGFFSREGTR